MALHYPRFEIILMTRTVIKNQYIKTVLEKFCGDNVQFWESEREKIK